MNNERIAMLVFFILLNCNFSLFRRHYHYFPTLNLLIENIRKIEKLKRDIINENRIKNNPKAVVLKKIFLLLIIMKLFLLIKLKLKI